MEDKSTGNTDTPINLTEIPATVTILPENRWEQGIDHDKRSRALFKFMQEYDWKFNGDGLELQSGGDGDNGESLMYLMDEYFAAADKLCTGGAADTGDDQEN